MTEPLRLVTADQTDVGSYFVATYPPFSVWNQADVEGAALPALHTPPAPGAPLGLYLHIPFCRKRCHFCYFRVYTDKNSEDVTGYLDTLVGEWQLYSRMPAIEGRPRIDGPASVGASIRAQEGVPFRLAHVCEVFDVDEEAQRSEAAFGQ